MRDDATGNRILFVGISPKIHSGTASALARDYNLAGVAAEGFDVVAHPFDGQPLIAEGEVLGRTGLSRKSPYADTVVERHNDQVFMSGKFVAVEEGRVTLANGETTPMDEDQNRLQLRGLWLGPDVQGQTVFALSVIELTGEIGDDPLCLRCSIRVVDPRGGCLRTGVAIVGCNKCSVACVFLG